MVDLFWLYTIHKGLSSLWDQLMIFIVYYGFVVTGFKEKAGYAKKNSPTTTMIGKFLWLLGFPIGSRQTGRLVTFSC